ncbi:MAG: AraC family transcriptional regulator [Cytophagales bacterium]|nr:AraC family transcriptional regulator [Cytophagales bacterium]
MKTQVSLVCPFVFRNRISEGGGRVVVRRENRREFRAEGHELFVLLMKSGSLKLEGRAHPELSAGELILLKGNSKHAVCLHAEKNDKPQAVSIGLSCQAVHEFLEAVSDFRSEFPAENAEEFVVFSNVHPSLKGLSAKLLKALDQDKEPLETLWMQLFFQELFLELLESHAGFLFSCCQNGHSEGFRSELEKRITENLEEEYLTAEQLAMEACMSRAAFFRRFKEAFGQTPAAYIRKRRMDWACELLRSTEEPVTQIAYQSGFRNVSHFITCFGKCNGMSPRVFRKKYRRATAAAEQPDCVCN